ncbi:hypothetical protein K2X30_12075 [bacterium]|nr:hypothetical protein [bacterium]
MNLIDKLVFLKSCVATVKDPNNTEDILRALEKALTPEMAAPVIAHLKSDPQTKQAVESRLFMPYFKMEELEAYPEGTLAKELFHYYKKNGFEPTFFPMEEDNELNYLRSRVRKTHDIWHVVTGFDTSLPGELGLLGFAYQQMRSAPSVLVFILGLLHALIYKREILGECLESFNRGWTLGKNTRMIFGVDWLKMIGLPLTEVRAQMRLQPQKSLVELGAFHRPNEQVAL